MKTAIATLICVYGGDSVELFEQAIDSIARQDLDPGFESRIYLGVDGPVSQAMENCIAMRAAEFFTIHRSDVNRGLAATLNSLIQELGNEEFVFRMDADDVSLPSRYQKQLEYMAAHPEISILGTDILEIDSETGAERRVRFCKGPKDAIATIHMRVPVAHPSVCFRRQVFHEVKGYPTAGTNEDIALWFECIRLGMSFDNIPEVLLRFRISKNFWKRRSFAKSQSELACYTKGIFALNGLFTTKYAYPAARFLVRIAPTFLARWAYGSSFRTGK